MPFYTVERARVAFFQALQNNRPDVIDDLVNKISGALQNDPYHEFEGALGEHQQSTLPLDRKGKPVALVTTEDGEVVVPVAKFDRLIAGPIKRWSTRWNLRADWLVTWAKALALSKNSIFSFPDPSVFPLEMLMGDDFFWWNLAMNSKPLTIRIEMPWYVGWFPSLGRPSKRVLDAIWAVENGVLEALSLKLRSRLTPEQNQQYTDEYLLERVKSVHLQSGVVPDLSMFDVPSEPSPGWPPQPGEGKTEARDRLKKLMLADIDKKLTEYLSAVEKAACAGQLFNTEHFDWLIRRVVPEKDEKKGETWTNIERSPGAKRATRKTIQERVNGLAGFIDLSTG